VTHQNITFEDLKRLAAGHAPNLAQCIIQYTQQAPIEREALPDGALTADDFETALASAQREYSEAERRMKVALLWRRFLSQDELQSTGNYALADFLVELYQQDAEPLRAALIELIDEVDFVRGVWGGIKRIFKIAEQRQDALILGAIIARLDRSWSTGAVSRGTIVYMQRRSWRYLRYMARALPPLYPVFAGAVLRYAKTQNSIVANILNPSEDYLEQPWKLTPDPLMVLLETVNFNEAAEFAIRRLKQTFPAELQQQVSPMWLARLAARPLAPLHNLVVEILKGNPDYHPARLEALGLKRAVLDLLLSPSRTACEYAIEYARAYATDLSAVELVRYATGENKHVREWALSVLEAIPVKKLGLPLLATLLGHAKTASWAGTRLDTGFDQSEISHAFLVEQLLGTPSQRHWAVQFLVDRVKDGAQIAACIRQLLSDPKASQDAHYRDVLAVTQPLVKNLYASAQLLGANWLLERVGGRFRDFAAAELRRADALPDLDIEAVKSRVFDRNQRDLMLYLLGKHARFKAIGLPWLLALARRTDPALANFASHMLLAQVAPPDFGDGDAARGVKRLLDLATGKEPDPVRLFAQTYLRCHHPVVGKDQPETAAHAITPKLTAADYPLEPYWKALGDSRADVRKFAITIAKADMRRWGAMPRVYELADSEHREVRALCLQALRLAGTARADAACTLLPEEIEPAEVFRLTESRNRESREVAMELITQYYERLGGPERLAWLMASADRGVRTMAVRMLWERHRPITLPEGWQPRGPLKQPTPAGRFANVAVLQAFLRTLMFGLPPGRNPDAREYDLPRRHVSAQTAKRHAIAAATALAQEDEGFARALLPLLLEFAGSIARGEWQACLAALTQLKRSHPHLDVGLTLKA
jgi:hypothetical protein